MKRLLLLFPVLFVFFCAFAQEEGRQAPRKRMTVEERAKRTTEWMKTTLSLTDEQVAPVDSINLLYTKAQHVLIQSAEGDRSKVKESLEALEVQKIESLKAILTPEQIELYKEKMKDRRETMRNRDGRKFGPQEGGRRSQRPSPPSGE